jgi:hypothetical protein
MKRAIAVIAAGLLAVVFVAQPVQADDGAVRTYEITISNLNSGQPFSPPIFVTHTGDATIFTPGQKAPEGIRLIAEQGNSSMLASATRGMPGVSHVLATNMPIHRIGGPGSVTRTLTIDASGSAHWLSMAAMLICTNDGFVGLNSVRLPDGMNSLVYYARGYDAGTEINDQLYTNLGDPCGQVGPVTVAPDGMNLRTPESGVIRHHPGTAPNVGDQGARVKEYGWGEPVAKIIVRRVK